MSKSITGERKYSMVIGLDQLRFMLRLGMGPTSSLSSLSCGNSFGINFVPLFCFALFSNECFLRKRHTHHEGRKVIVILTLISDPLIFKSFIMEFSVSLIISNF